MRAAGFALALLLHTASAAAATWTVNSADDSNDALCDATHCSLREALLTASGVPGTDTIAFAIPGAGPHTITPGSALPTVSEAVVIDGFTQSGASANTQAPGSGIDAVLMIEIDGSGAGSGTSGLHITGGGTTVRGLVINGFDQHGIHIETLGGNTIEGNFIGTDPTGALDLGNGVYGVRLDAAGNTIGGTAASARNLISGNPSAGVYALNAGSQTIQGNYVGTDATGQLAIENGQGIQLQSSDGCQVGGTAAGARNLLSGNLFRGLINFFSDDLVVEGNYVGTNADGTAALPNGRINTSGGGVRTNAGTNVRIGGTAAGAGNLISGNDGPGVTLENFGSLSTVQGNLIGTDATGTLALPNEDDGVLVSGGDAYGIGGTTAAARNVISGNGQSGIELANPGSGATNNTIQGNYIGTDVTGTLALPNGHYGIVAGNASNDNTFGGSAAGAGNLISGNTFDGILLTGADTNLIEGNRIGTDVTGTLPLPNLQGGIQLVNGADGNTIGGTAAGAGNTIAFNGREGIHVGGIAELNNAILSNSIFSNTDLGIDLRPSGGGLDDVTPNDPGDPDTGGNNLQNFPVLSRVLFGASDTTVQGDLNSTASTQFRVELFSSTSCDPLGHGEGETFLGHADVTTDAGGDVSFSTVVGSLVPFAECFTATATDLLGNTSEFSARYDDSDGDDLSDVLEASMCTDPMDPDSDDDGLRDGTEDLNGSGGVDAGETDPCDPDTDGDGLLDGFEIDNGFDPLVPGEQTSDLDGDDLTALEEQIEGTDPTVPDSDGDGIADGHEVKVTLSDPNDADTDGDLVNDSTDNCRLVPNGSQADSDGDGRGDDCDSHDPLDLSDPTPRTVLLEFEQSFDIAVVGVAWPEAGIAASYTSSGSIRTITVPGTDWEQVLLANTTINPDPGSVSDVVIQLDANTGDLLAVDFSYDVGGNFRIFTADSSTMGGWTTNPIIPGVKFFCPDPPGGCVQTIPTATYDAVTGEAAGLGPLEIEEFAAIPPPRDVAYSGDIRLSEVSPPQIPALPILARLLTVGVLLATGLLSVRERR